MGCGFSYYEVVTELKEHNRLFKTRGFSLKYVMISFVVEKNGTHDAANVLSVF